MSDIKLGCLVSVRLTDGRTRRFHNWNRDQTKEILTFQNKNYKYFSFPVPPLNRTIGERAESVSLILPLVGASEYGYFPLREWIASGALSNALLEFTIFDFAATIYRHHFTVAEIVTTRSEGQSVAELRLRQPDDRTSIVMTAVYNHKTIGDSPSYSAF